MKTLGAIVKRFAIAFFFFCFITTLLYAFCFKKINLYIRAFNNFTYVPKENEKKPVTIDLETKEITHYPYYGEKFALIKIPALNITVDLYHGDSLEILKKGAGHYSGSYFPSEGGTILIAAHNRSEYFKYLPNLKLEDEIILDTIYGVFTYQVTEGKVMTIKELEKIRFTQDKEMLVLYTCYPMNALGFTNERYVIYASLKEVSYEN